MTEVRLTADARDDLLGLDGAAQLIVLKALKKLRSEPEKCGAPLGSRSGGNLTTFRKLVVGDRDYRIIYRVDPMGRSSWCGSSRVAATTRYITWRCRGCGCTRARPPRSSPSRWRKSGIGRSPAPAGRAKPIEVATTHTI